MYIEKNKISKSQQEKITTIFSALLIVLSIFLIFSFWTIQILKNSHFKELALKNINKTIELSAPRGLIVDRNNKVLAENQINFTLFLSKENITDLDQSLNFISKELKISKDFLQKRYDKYANYSKSRSIPLVKNLSLKDVIKIKSQEEEYSEFEVTIKPMRSYPLKNVASHIIGYISELSNNDLKKNKNYKLGDMDGKVGIEKIYERYFYGDKGFQNVIIDNVNKVREITDEKKPVIGKTIVLTVDLDLQNFLEEIFKDHKGVLAVADLKTGGILAMVSKPNYDPSFFISMKDEERWQEMINDPLKPLNNRFVQGLYSPGSVFKIVMTILGLEEGLIDRSTKVFCTGVTNVYNRPFHCWKEYGHGSVEIIKAIEDSCNIYFYKLGARTDIETIHKYSKNLGLGIKTGIDLSNEKSGLIPSKEWKMKRFGQTWYKGETISVSIGQGPLLVTPAQILKMISTVALRGKSPKLHFLKEIRQGNKIIKKYKPEFSTVQVKEENFNLLIDGLEKVVEKGTGISTKLKDIKICGKTGTVQIITKENPKYEELVKQDKFKPHAWFASFAPKKEPEIAVIIFVENGGGAGTVAVPIANKIYRRYFKK